MRSPAKSEDRLIPVRTLERAGVTALLLIPTYNESEALPGLFARLEPVGGQVDILVVDDASPDGTAAEVRRRQPGWPGLYVWEQPARCGFGESCRRGLRWAVRHGYRHVLQMDADLSHDPAEIPALLALGEQADLAVGSRYCGAGAGTRNWSWWREALSRGAGRYVRWWTGLPLSDPTAGFRCYRTSALAEGGFPASHADGYAFQVEMAHGIWRRGGKLAEHPIVFHERQRGASKMSWKVVWEAICLVPSLSRRR